MSAQPGLYPVTFTVDPPAVQSRLTVFFRYILAIPHLVILYALGIAQSVVTLIAWFAILFTGKYPTGMYRFSAGCLRWSTRASGYVYLLTGQYPPFSLEPVDGYPVRIGITEQLTGRNRVTTFFRIILVIPHAIVLAFIGIAAAVVLLIAWIVALFTARVPDGLHNFLAGTLRWSTRVNAYMYLLVDDYPPFSLS